MVSGLAVAWVSRHSPTVEQAAALAEAGYRRWVKVDPPGPYRVISGEDAYDRAVDALGHEPDLFVVKLPMNILAELKAFVGERIPIIIPVTRPTGEWTGGWREVTKAEIVYRDWMPNPCRK